jgi:hypothetical protein
VDVAEAALKVTLELAVGVEFAPVAHEFGARQVRMVCQERPAAQKIPRAARAGEGTPKVVRERPHRRLLFLTKNITWCHFLSSSNT